MAFPGQSLSILHRIISEHLMLGSGSGIVPSGHSQIKDPSILIQFAPIPHEFSFKHSFKSKHSI